MAKSQTRNDLLPGTLEMLILKTLTYGPQHGYGIAQFIQQTSEDVLRVEEGSLYPALQRLLIKELVAAEWKQTPLNRRARYYKLTPLGRKQLSAEEAHFDRMIEAIARVMRTA